MAAQVSAQTGVLVPPRHPARSSMLNIYFDRSSPSEILVTDIRYRVALCIVSVSLNDKPNMRVERLTYVPLAEYHFSSQRRTEKRLVGQVSFDESSGTINLELASSILSLQAKGRLTRSFEFESTMGPLIWQHDGVFGNGLQLLDAEKRRVARLSNAELVPGDSTRLQIMGGEHMTREWMEEILISSLAVLEWKRRIGRVGGLSTVDAKRVKRKLVAAVARFSEPTRQIREWKRQWKTTGGT